MADTLTIEFVGDISKLARSSSKASQTLVNDMRDAEGDVGRSANRMAGRVENAFDGIHGRIGTRFGPGFASVGGKLGGALAAGFAAIGVGQVISFLGDATAEAEEAAAGIRVTEQVIKTTGGAANVAADDIDRLTRSLEETVAIDGDLIREGSNVLLTFKNVRNEVGAGNDIFDQANGLMLDLSTVMGGDIPGSAKILGKALNDPITGLTTLRRVGVQFTDAQKLQIERMVEAGDIMGAQKIILGELAGQLGGTAEAAKTGGKKMSVAWGNAKEALGEGLIPVVEDMAGVFEEDVMPMIEGDLIPLIKDLADVFREDAIPAIKRVIGFLGDLTESADTDGEGTSAAVRKWLGVEVPQTLEKSGRAFDRYAGKIEDAKKDGIKSFRGLTDLLSNRQLTWGEKFGLIWSDMWSENTEAEQRNLDRMEHSFDVFRGVFLGDTRRFGRGLNGLFGDTFKRIGDNIRVRLFVIRLMWRNWLDDISAATGGWGDRIVAWWGRLPRRITDALGNIGRRIKDQFMDVLGGGLTIPFKLAFGDGLGIGALGDRGGSLLGVSPFSAVGQAYSALGRPGDVISGLRPGARTLSGNLSYHARGRALDITPIFSIAAAFRKAFGPRILELITPWPSMNLWHGQPHRYSSAVQAQHSGSNAHIHVAMAKGGYGTVTRPTTFLAGEAGAEDFAFVPHSKGGMRGGDVIINVNVQGSVISERELLTLFRRFLRTNGGVGALARMH